MSDKPNRFKGIVYGLPLTKDVPYIGKRLEDKGGIPQHSAKEVRQRLNIQNRLNVSVQDAAAGIRRGDEFDGARMLVPVMQIRPYDRNPRRSINPKFDEIKESIRAVGLLTPFNITRRPNEEHYIICGGGNTRLVILQQLFQEGHKQFEHVEVVFRVWRGEAHAIAGHIGENDQRGDMSFWDKAAGIMEIKAALEAERGGVLSLRDFEAELKRLGLSVSLTTISFMKFALDRLEPLGQRLTGLDVKRIKPWLNTLTRLGDLWGIKETQLYEEIINPVMHEHAVGLAPESSGAEIERLMRRLEAGLAARIGVDESRCAKMMAALEKSPGATRADLEMAEVRSRTAAPTPAADSAQTRRQGAAFGAEQRAVIGASSVASPEDDEADEASTPLRQGSPSADERAGAERAGAGLDLRQSLRNVAERLARAGGVAGLFAPSEAMPLGYYMEAAPLPQDENLETARALWWLLACASGQLDPELAQRLPGGSRWRRVYLQEAGVDESAYPIMVEDDLLAYTTPDGQAALDPWSLLQILQHDALGGLCLELAQLAAQARAADPVAHRHLLEATHRKG